jgi:hypothetical protein
MTEVWPFPWEFYQAKYSEHYLGSQVTEAQVQADIVSLLTVFDVDVVPIDAGGRRQRGRMIRAAKTAGIHLAGIQNVKNGAEIPKGFADLEATLAPTGRSLYIEVKAPAWLGAKNKVIRRAGKPSPEQLEFLLSKHRRGAVVLVAWSSADVQNYLGSALELNRKALR